MRESNSPVTSRTRELRAHRDADDDLSAPRERVEAVLPKIVKQDKRREDFDRRKLLAGIRRACEKRSISVDAIERMLDRIERRLQESGEKEVTSRYLGERTMEELRSLDPIAAVRFASVFRNFQSADDYAAFLASLEVEEPDERS